MNFLTNAIDALQETAQQQMNGDRHGHSGKICISTEMIDQNLVQIAIADNGSGIPDTVRSRIFDLFLPLSQLIKVKA